MANPTTKTLFAGAIIIGACLPFAAAPCARAEAPFATRLGKILVLDKSQGGPNNHLESRRNLNRALAGLAADKGFEIATLGQDDSASAIRREFSAANLAQYQAVIFSNNEGVDAQLDSVSRSNVEAFVKNGGGLIAVHAAQDFVSDWPWYTQSLVRLFYGPHGTNKPFANLAHDPEGTRPDSETKGIFKGLTAPLAFTDEFYSFQASPRGTPGVTILLTVDERTYTQPVDGPMGEDHPVVWSKTEGRGRVVNFSLGHSWDSTDVFAQKDGYLKDFLYGTLRYAAGDFTGCTNNGYKEFNPDATHSEPTACLTPTDADPISSRPAPAGGSWILPRAGSDPIRVDILSPGPHAVALLDVAGKVVASRYGAGPARYAFPVPGAGGIYVVRANAGGRTRVQRVTVL